MAKTIDFTVAAIEAIKPPASGRLEFKDSKAQGLYLRVTSNGVKTFSFVGRAKGATRVERLTFGKYPTVRPDEARRKARVIAGELADGVSAAAAAREQRGELTMADLYDKYTEALKLKGKDTVHPESLWRMYVQPAFGTRRLSEVKATDLERWHRSIPALVVKRQVERAAELHARAKERFDRVTEARKLRAHGPAPRPVPPQPPAPPAGRGQTTANNCMALVRAMFYWALEPKRALFVGTNPAAMHDLYPARERERFLHPDELRPFFAALAEEQSTTMRDFILVALLTGARRSNVTQMRWAEVSLTRGEWSVSGEKMKNGEPQTITLGPEAVAILKERKKGSKSLFMKRSGIDNLRLHDLRRTLGSWQARTGASLVIIGKSLNHKSPEATAIYARLDLDPVRQSVERATSAMFEAAGVKPQAEVIELPKRAKKTAKKSDRAA